MTKARDRQGRVMQKWMRGQPSTSRRPVLSQALAEAAGHADLTMATLTVFELGKINLPGRPAGAGVRTGTSCARTAILPLLFFLDDYSDRCAHAGAGAWRRKTTTDQPLKHIARGYARILIFSDGGPLLRLGMSALRTLASRHCSPTRLNQAFPFYHDARRTDTPEEARSSSMPRQSRAPAGRRPLLGLPHRPPDAAPLNIPRTTGSPRAQLAPDAGSSARFDTWNATAVIPATGGILLGGGGLVRAYSRPCRAVARAPSHIVGRDVLKYSSPADRAASNPSVRARRPRSSATITRARTSRCIAVDPGDRDSIDACPEPRRCCKVSLRGYGR